jgi:hypothetical protein
VRYELDKRPEVLEEYRRCCRLVEQFARDYVDKWIGVQGDRAKAEGWAILQAAKALERDHPMITIPE